MRLLQCIFYNNKCYKKGEKIKPTRIVVHSTGCYNTTLKRYVQPHSEQNSGMKELYPTKRNYTRSQMMTLLGDNQYDNDWNKDNLDVCVHAFIGRLADGTIATVQTLPWDMRPWGCGKGSKGSFNDCAIQFEICEDNHTSASYCKETYKEAVEFCAMLCKEHNIDPSMIVSHDEARVMGYGSNHNDPNNWWPKFGLSMDGFRADVSKLLQTAGKPTAPSDTSDASVNLLVGDVIKLSTDAKYTSGQSIPGWVINSTLYAREIRANGDIVFSTQKTGAITGIVEQKYIIADKKPTSTTNPVAPSTIVNLAVDDELKLVSGAKYTNGSPVPDWVINSKLYVREIHGDNIVFSTQKTGAITGAVNKQYIKASEKIELAIGDKVKLVSGAKYTNGHKIPCWLFLVNLYVREINGDNVVISTLKTGAITGVVTKKDIKKV